MNDDDDRHVDFRFIVVIICYFYYVIRSFQMLSYYFELS